MTPSIASSSYQKFQLESEFFILHCKMAAIPDLITSSPLQLYSHIHRKTTPHCIHITSHPSTTITKWQWQHQTFSIVRKEQGA